MGEPSLSKHRPHIRQRILQLDLGFVRLCTPSIEPRLQTLERGPGRCALAFCRAPREERFELREPFPNVAVILHRAARPASTDVA